MRTFTHIRPIAAIAVAATVLAIAATLGTLSHRGRGQGEGRHVEPETPATGPPTALLSRRPTDLRAYVAAHSADPDPKVQDLVGHARITLAYDSAGRKDWKAARTMLLTAAKEYKGTGAMADDFGGIPDQARYQAAACLMAEGRKDEAKAELLRFMKEQSLSPLCKAAYRRLVMLNGNKSTPELESLLQHDVSAQEEHVRFETSVCGPKCIERVVRSFGRSVVRKNSEIENRNSKIENPPAPSGPTTHRPNDPTTYYIAALCGTTDKGTSIEGMRKGLRALGYETFAYQLDAADLAKAPTPAILLIGNHYLVMEKEFLGKATVYDPRYERTTEMTIPKDEAFSVAAILFSQPELGGRGQGAGSSE